MTTRHYPFEPLPLPYPLDGLEPFIDEKTMRIHHDKHYVAYVEGLNRALQGSGRFECWTLGRLYCESYALPRCIREAVVRNAGGVFNHEFFFGALCKRGQDAPKGCVASAIHRSFGSFENFQKKFTAAALELFGSGYVWLVLRPDRTLCIMTSPNQHHPCCREGCPLLTLDVWEHAYYLKHQNRRADYLDCWWRVVNWNCVEERYLRCCCRV